MYQDQSSNFMTAMQGVDALTRPLTAALESIALRRTVHYRYETSVSLEAYERLEVRYEELAKAAEWHIRKLRLQSARQALEIAHLKAQLAGRHSAAS